MIDEDVIEDITAYFDSQEELHVVHSLKDVESVFRQIETYMSEKGYLLEHEVESSDFTDVPYSSDLTDEGTEVKFVIPIVGTDLVLEFFYSKSSENEYQTYVDVDFYFETEDEESNE